MSGFSYGYLDSILVLGIAGFGLLVLGLVNGLLAFGRMVSGMRSRTWPTVEGRILESRVRSSRSWYGRTPRTVFVPEITYEYVLEDRRYVSERVAMGSVTTSFAHGSERVVDAFAPGATVPIHYHPARPELTVLLAGPRAADVVALVGAAAAGIVGAAVVQWSWSMGARPERLLELVARIFG